MSAFTERVQLQALRLLGARFDYLATRHGRVHRIEVPGRGELPAVLLLHGLTASGADYFPLIRRLRPHVRRIVAVDMPGHGLSDVPRRGLTADGMHEGLLDALDLASDEPLVLFGSSLGGLAAVRYAARRPERVRGVFLASPAGGPMDEAQMRLLLDGFDLRSLRQARAFIARAFARPHPLQLLMAWGLQERAQRPWIRQLMADLGPRHLLRPEELSSLAMPLLLSWGGREAVLPREHLAFWRTHLPRQARIEEPAEHGHVPFVTHSDAVVARLQRFLREEVAPKA